MNHHTLADFRVDHVDALDELLTRSVAALIVEGHVTLTRVAGDGIAFEGQNPAQERTQKRMMNALALCGSTTGGTGRCSLAFAWSWSHSW